MNVRPVAWPASAQRPNAWELLQSRVEEVVPGLLVSLVGIGLLVYGCAGRDSLRPPPPPEPVLAVAPPPAPEPEPEVVARVERALLKSMATEGRRGPPRPPRPPPPAPPAPLAVARAEPPVAAPATTVAPPPQIAARPAQARSEPPRPPEAPGAPAPASDASRPPVAAAALIPAPVSMPAPPVTTAAPATPVVSATAPAIIAKPKAPIPPPPPSPARSAPVSTPARVIAAKPPPPPPPSVPAPETIEKPPPPPALSAPAPALTEAPPSPPPPPATVAAATPAPQPAAPAKRIDRKKRPTPMTAQDATLHLTAAWEEATGEPATLQVISVLWAQWALETGRGRWMVDYNYAGLKGRAPDGGAANWWTWEETDKGTRRIRARFRSYETASEGALDYVQLLLRLYPRAVKAAREGNASAFVLELEQGGFFTDCPKHYVPSVTSLALEFRRQHRAARF
jgi:hypothetical protein